VGQTIAFCGLPSSQATENDGLPHPDLCYTEFSMRVMSAAVDHRHHHAPDQATG
jgi:hypothetical protein